ncbi:hypothetical protein KHS38_06735 [Mucilaginibacter sp. Bleaf8]|uniref:glycoside hydrolase family 76 protein n=1 Tax=Mucilaginibacter sp. Bleaf8 TaxID=2834430 RepID=UPI001BCC35C1|nr:glycoside hydrolase family 76 protein [Mucilaginibacter sp. Bleaf8]MBS7564098.1 hypothetical protein [Mucilaginibacter sp. Bleaf8]
MNKLYYFFSCVLFIAFASCSKATDTPAPAPAKPGLPNGKFTLQDAATAYKSFNDFFYNPSAKLYYSTTKRDNLAAIWTQAIYWDMAMHVYDRTKDAAQLKLITDIYEGGAKQYDNYNWNNTQTWFIYDDMMWWIISLARAYEITHNDAYLQKAISGFSHVWAGSYDPVDGGMFWDFKHTGKNSCINYPTVIAAMRLYKITKDEAYLTKAKAVYGWARANLFDAAKGRVADNKIGNNKPGFQDYTYNYGTCIGAAVMLYKTTNDKSYLADAKLAADYTMNSVSTNGILPAEGDWNEQGVLKAIFAQYIMSLVNDAGQTQYLPWIQKNINAGWNHRDVKRGLTYRNYAAVCPSGDIQSYEASSIVAFMQLCPPEK